MLSPLQCFYLLTEFCPPVMDCLHHFHCSSVCVFLCLAQIFSLLSLISLVCFFVSSLNFLGYLRKFMIDCSFQFCALGFIWAILKLVGLGEKTLACSFIFCIFAKRPWHVELHFSFKVDVDKLMGKREDVWVGWAKRL